MTERAGSGTFMIFFRSHNGSKKRLINLLPDNDRFRPNLFRKNLIFIRFVKLIKFIDAQTHPVIQANCNI